MAIETVPSGWPGWRMRTWHSSKFLLASGSLKEVAGLYGVTYPTVRLRLDRLIQKIHLSEDTAADSVCGARQELAVADKLVLILPTADPELQKRKEDVHGNHNDAGRSGQFLPAFTVLAACRRFFWSGGSIWPGLVLPCLGARLYAVVLVLSLYSCAGCCLDRCWAACCVQPGFGASRLFAADGVLFICRSGRRRKKQLEKMAEDLVRLRHYLHCQKKDARAGVIRYGAPCFYAGHLFFRCKERFDVRPRSRQ